MLEGSRNALDGLVLFHEQKRQADRIQKLGEVETVRYVMRPRIADHAAQSGEDKKRNVVAVVDFGDGVDAGRQAGGPHESQRGNAAEEGAGTEADGGFLAVHRDVLETIVLVDGIDQRSDPVVGQARHELDPALNELFDDQRSRFFLLIAHHRCHKLRVQAVSSR